MDVYVGKTVKYMLNKQGQYHFRVFQIELHVSIYRSVSNHIKSHFHV